MSSAVLIPLMTGILALIGAAIAATLQGRANLTLENQRFRSQLILQAIQTGDRDQAASNLRFLLHTHLLLDTDSGLSRYLDTTSALPVLPSATQQPAYTPGNLPSGDTVEVRLTLPYRADIQWYRDLWKGHPDLVQRLPTPLGPGPASFRIAPGGWIHVLVKRAGTSDSARDIEIDCRLKSRCEASVP